MCFVICKQQGDDAMFNDMLVQWYVGDACNLACPYCTNAGNVEALTFAQQDVDKAVALINATPRVCTLHVLGGEPTCHGWLASALKSVTGVRNIELLTNGVRVDILQTLVYAGIQHNDSVRVEATMHPAAWRTKQDLVETINNLLAMDNGKWIHIDIKCLLAEDEDSIAVNECVAEHVPDEHLIVVVRRSGGCYATITEAVHALQAIKSKRLKRLLRQKISTWHTTDAGPCPASGHILCLTPWGVTGVQCGTMPPEYMPWSTSVDDMLRTIKNEKVMCAGKCMGYAHCNAMIGGAFADVV